MRKLLAFALAATAVATAIPVKAQCSFPAEPDDWHFGVGGGYHHTFASLSKIDKSLYPETFGGDNGVFSIFVKKSFGEKQHLAIRPELTFVNRSGGLKNIFSNITGFYEAENLRDVRYKAKGKYVDIRVPVMWQFCTPASRVRPYVYIAPILGFNHGGYVMAEEQSNLTASEKGYGYSGLRLDATKANMNSIYFAGAAAVGIDFNFNVEGNPFFLGIEAMYEYGFTNTYGKDSEAANKYFLSPGTRLPGETDGSRKFSGLELKVTLGVPFSVFSKKPQPQTVAVEPQIVYVEREVPETKVEEEDKPCYSLEEINDLMIKGESVKGKTICAIDDAINFDTGKSQIKSESFDYLDRLAETLKRTNSRIKVKGHTDNVGTEEFNLNLSKDRAMSVMNYLLRKGVKRENLSYDYYGFSLPITSNDTEEGRRLNRRVEFEILN